MSNVLARKRGVSSMDFYRRADELRITLTKALMNENIVPKRWRPVFTFPTITMLQELMGHIITANTIYPCTVDLVSERKRLQTYAIADCERIDDQLQYLLSVLYYGKIDADHPMPALLQEAGDLIDLTTTRLKEWRRSTKLLRDKQQH